MLAEAAAYMLKSRMSLVAPALLRHGMLQQVRDEVADMDTAEALERARKFVSDSFSGGHAVKILTRNVKKFVNGVPTKMDESGWEPHPQAVAPSTDSVDPLIWWPRNASRLPFLSVVARMVFAIPVTSASSERTFSGASRTITRDRASLSAENASSLVFMRANKHLLPALVGNWRTDEESKT